MPLSFLTTALLVSSIATGLTVEVVKRLLDETKTNYSSNVLAAIVSILIALSVSFIYTTTFDIVWTTKVSCDVATLMFLSFLASTSGYDKVIQLVDQITKLKGGDDHDSSET